MNIFEYNIFNDENITAGYSVDFNGLYRYCNQDDIPHFTALTDAYGLPPKNIIRVKQKHTDNILVANDTNAGEGVFIDKSDNLCDAIITNTKKLMICIVTADCVPVFIYDELNKAIAVVHSGRVGTAKEIAMKTVLKMQDVFSSKPENIKCIFGPYLSQSHHEVEEKDIFSFYNNYSSDECAKFLIKNGEKYHVDMGKAITISLSRIGVPENNIIDTGICTFENTSLYSWRRDHIKDARNISFMFIK